MHQQTSDKRGSMRKVFWILVFIIAMSIVLPAIVLLIYRNHMTGLTFELSMKGISNKPDDWSAFGSLISGLFTWSGALSTLAALAFAFWQNDKLSKEAKLRSEKDEETARKNQEFMDFQRERMSFEKFRIHQLMFNELLDALEAGSNGQFQFRSKSFLYKNIFPDNDFLQCHTNVGPEIKNPGGLYELIEVSELIDSRLGDNTYNIEPHLLITDISVLQDSMRVRINRSREEGDLIFAGKLIFFNLIDTYNTFLFYQNAVNSIISFCGVNKVINLVSNADTPRLILNLASLSSQIDYGKVSNPSSPMEYLKSDNLNRIVAAYKNFNTSSENPLYPIFNKLAAYILESLTPTAIHYHVTNDGLKLLLDSLISRSYAARYEANALGASFGTLFEQHIRVIMDIRKELD